MGIQQAFMASGAVSGSGPVSSIPRWDITSSNTAPAYISAGLTVNTDGTITLYGDLVVSAGGTQWYSPTTPAIGNSYWVRLSQLSTAGSGGFNGGAALGSWLALTSARTWTIDTSGLGVGDGLRQSTFNLEFASDSGGATIVGRMLNCTFIAQQFYFGGGP